MTITAFVRSAGITLAAISVSPAVSLAQDQPAKEPAPASQPAIKPVPAVAVPSAKEVIARYIAALGGEDALRKLTSRTETGKIEMPGIVADFKLVGAAPDRRIVTVSSPTLGDQIQGYDGTVAWDIVGGKSRVLSGAELAYRALTCDFYRPLNLATKFELRSMGVEDRGGKACVKIGATPIAGSEKNANKPDAEKPRETTLYFDVDSGMLVGQIVLRPSANGDLGVDTTYAEFKAFDGVMVPTKVTSKVLGAVQTVTVSKVEFNTVPANTFDIPESVRALLPKTGETPSKPATDPAPASGPDKK